MKTMESCSPLCQIYKPTIISKKQSNHFLATAFSMNCSAFYRETIDNSLQICLCLSDDDDDDDDDSCETCGSH